MSRRHQYTQDQKVWACEQYLSNSLTSAEIAEQLNMGPNGRKVVVDDWVKKYKAKGPSAFQNRPRNTTYSKEFKLKVVEEYLAGGISSYNLALKYGIPSHQTVLRWVSRYNEGGEQNKYRPQREKLMKAGRKTTLEERIEIADYCLTHDRNYKETAERFDCSYQQVRNWTLKLEQGGEEALKDGRGCTKKQEELTQEELQKREIADLKRKISYLEMENELLKKAEDLERRLIKTW